MPKLRVLSGEDAVKILTQFGFTITNQKGSHIKLLRITVAGERQILTIPNHKVLDRGTTKGIFNQAARYISQSDLRPYFYS